MPRVGALTLLIGVAAAQMGEGGGGAGAPAPPAVGCDNPASDADCGGCAADGTGGSAEERVDRAKHTFELKKHCLEKVLEAARKDHRHQYHQDALGLMDNRTAWEVSAKHKAHKEYHYAKLSTHQTWDREWQVLMKQYKVDREGLRKDLFQQDHSAYMDYKDKVKKADDEFADKADAIAGPAQARELVRQYLSTTEDRIPQGTSGASIAFLCAAVVALVAGIAARPARRGPSEEAKPLLGTV